jgi:hypothetical protein
VKGERLPRYVGMEELDHPAIQAYDASSPVFWQGKSLHNADRRRDFIGTWREHRIRDGYLIRMD